MITRTLTATTVVLLLGVGAGAQESPQKPAPPTPPATEQAIQVRPERPGQPVNIRLDLTITDETTPGKPATRTVTMILADGQTGNIRSAANQGQARIFVEASPQLLSDGHVRLFLGIEYNPRQAVLVEDKETPQPMVVPQVVQPTGGSSLSQRLTVVLHPDKPLVISQAADPVSDRTISVEVRATVLK